LDGERKRQRNVDARLDPAQGGTGELLGAYNRHWSAAARGNSHGTNPLLSSTAAQGDRRFRPFDSRGNGHGNGNGNGNEPETRSLDGFSVGLSDGGGSGASGSRHTRRTEALYLEASLRAARKDAMREAYADQGFPFQPNFKDAATTKTWNPFSTRSLTNVVQRLYNPAAAGEKKAGNAAKAAAFELRHFVGTPDIKKLPTKVTRVRVT
jgi:hypothetical protein